jgi:hypothetical protein
MESARRIRLTGVRLASSALLSLIAVVVSGVIGWSAAFAGLDLLPWALVVAVLSSTVLIVMLAHRAPSHPKLSEMAVFGFAFALLTWPFLWLVVGLASYLITGQALGD